MQRKVLLESLVTYGTAGRAGRECFHLCPVLSRAVQVLCLIQQYLVRGKKQAGSAVLQVH